jgi:hypothetical protein
MKNLPHTKTLPAHYLDPRTQQLCNDAAASIAFHTQQNTAKTQAETEKELELFYKQLEALEKPVAKHLRADEKKTLRDFYKERISRNLQRLDLFINGMADTARALNCEVLEPKTEAQ